jgi:cysteine-rich repeat protein
LVCADLTQKKKEACSTGFEVVSSFCIDIWGDGSLQQSPQIYEWDDGNNENGDGWNEYCYKETDFTCMVVPTLNNRSYWYPKCGDGIFESADSEQCDDGNYYSGDGWNDSCQIEAKFKCTTPPSAMSICMPNWGDGILDTTPVAEGCDDGNNFDHDGWSKDWQQETSYTCSQDPITGISVWTTAHPRPVPVSQMFDEVAMQITVTFDQEMMQYSVKEGEIFVYVTGPNSPYSVNWSAQYSGNKFIVGIVSTPALIGGIGEELELQLAEINAFRSTYSIPMENPQTYTFTVPAPPASQSTQSGGAGASYTFLITMVISLGAGLLTGGSIELMWSLANTLQILFFLGLLDLYYTADLISVYEIMGYSNFDNPATEYLTKHIISSINLVQSPVNTKFDQLGFSSTNIIANSADKILVVFLMIVFMLTLAVMVYWLRNKEYKVAKWIKKVELSFRYESVTRFFIELVLNIAVASLINITYGANSSHFEDIVAYMLAWVLFLGILSLQAYTLAYPLWHFESVVEYPEHHERHCMLFLSFKTSSKKCMLYYGYFMMRRIFLAFVIVCMKDFSRTQWTLITLSSILMMLYNISFRPYIDQLDNFLNWFNEVILTFYSFMLFMFLSYERPTQLKISGFVCIGLIAIFFVVNWVVIFPVMIVKIAKAIKQKCTGKSKEEMEMELQSKTVINCQITRSNSWFNHF